MKVKKCHELLSGDGGSTDSAVELSNNVKKELNEFITALI